MPFNLLQVVRAISTPVSNKVGQRAKKEQRRGAVLLLPLFTPSPLVPGGTSAAAGVQQRALLLRRPGNLTAIPK